jgi:hypothetical protein
VGRQLRYEDVGLVAQIDVNRSRIQVLTQKQRLSSLQTEWSEPQASSFPWIVVPRRHVHDCLRQGGSQVEIVIRTDYGGNREPRERNLVGARGLSVGDSSHNQEH